MNPSTRRLIKDSERFQSRMVLLNARTKMLCVANSEHGVQRVSGFFVGAANPCKLFCGCRRELFLPTESERQTFDQARALQKQKLAQESEWAASLKPYEAAA